MSQRDKGLMMNPQNPPGSVPSIDVGEQLRHLIGDTGSVTEALGGYRLAVFHTTGFPWAEVFKVLLYRDFKVNVGRTKADLYIEATP